MHNLFRRFAQSTSGAVGSPWAFAVAVTAIAVWALTGRRSKPRLGQL